MQTIDVICVVFPNGEHYFMPADSDVLARTHKVMDAWKAQLDDETRTKYEDAQVMGGFLWMHMLEEDYKRIPATSLSHAISKAVEGA